MSIATQNNRVQVTLAGSGQVIPVDWYFLAAGDLAVVKTVGGVDTTLVLNTDYTVSGAANPAGGSITMAGGAAGDVITIYRNAAMVQPLGLSYNAQFPSASIAQALDRVTMLLQQIMLAANRSLRVPISNDEVATMTLADRASKLIGFDEDGDLDLSQGVADVVELAKQAALAQGNSSNIVYANVRAYGATGDNSTDDTAAIQAAIDSGAKWIVFPTGTYIVENLVMASNAVLMGFGAGTVLKLKATATTKVILNTDSSKTDLHFQGLSFDLNGVANSVALNLQDITRAVISGCKFSGNYGVYLLGTSSGVRISGCYFTGNYGIVTADSSITSDITVTGSVFKSLTGDGIALNCPTGTARSWTITGNTFSTIGVNSAAGFGVSFSGNYIDGVTVNGNTFYRCDHQAVHIEDGCRNISVVGNTMKDIGYGSAQTFRSGVYIAATISGREISNISIANNEIQGVADMQYGVYAGGSVTTDSLRISGNSVAFALDNGIFISSTNRGVVVANNVVRNGAAVGIRASGTNAQYIGNLCYDTQSPKTQTYGISANGGTDVFYAFNNVKDNLTGGFTVGSTDTRAHYFGNIETAAVDNNIKSGSKSHLAMTDTEIGMALPIVENSVNPVGVVGTVNDMPSSTYHVLRVDTANTTPQLTGVVARAGSRIIIKNNSGSSFDIMHENAGSTATNRFILKAGADLTLTSGQMRQFYYLGNRWNEI